MLQENKIKNCNIKNKSNKNKIINNKVNYSIKDTKNEYVLK